MDDIIGYPLLNRDEESGEFTLPKDGYYHIAPIGTFKHRASGTTQIIDTEAVQSMVDTFHDEEKAAGPHWPGILVDFDHFSNDTSKPSVAAGWIEDLKNRTDGLWAKIRWSDLGEEAVKGGRYRLISPVWNRSECEDLGDNKIKPLRLDRVAVTNDPVLKGMVPVSNRAEEEEGADETIEEEIPVAAKRSAPARKTGPVLNRRHFTTFDGERLPLAADKRRSVRNAA
jgi:phage I-like protein